MPTLCEATQARPCMNTAPLIPILSYADTVIVRQTPAGEPPALFTHIRKARKARPEHGIAVGDAYYRWFDQKWQQHFSKTKPEPHQYLWPERLAAIERLRTQEREQREEDERQCAAAHQRGEWTREFVAEFFGGRAPQGSSDGQKAANWKPEHGGPKPCEDARVFVCDEIRGHPTHMSVKRVGGAPAEVAAFIQHLILSARCTHCYEHMLYSLSRVESVEPFVVTLTASNYAGD